MLLRSGVSHVQLWIFSLWCYHHVFFLSSFARTSHLDPKRTWGTFCSWHTFTIRYKCRLCSLKVKWRLAAWSAKSKVKPADVNKAVKTSGTETLSTEYPIDRFTARVNMKAQSNQLVCSGYLTSAFVTTWRMLRTRCPSMRECLHRGCVPILHECIPWPHRADVPPNSSCGFDCVPQDYADTFRGLAKSSFQSWRFPMYRNPAYSMTSRLCWVPQHVLLRFLRGFNASCLSMFDFVPSCATCKEAA